ncbi:MAG: CPBP family intramembrane metalloprotease [Lachnospiraceae bacterium]|nr:CPBP family intramembrane metalloprotease [Lachnospiraceae bacterium]
MEPNQMNNEQNMQQSMQPMQQPYMQPMQQMYIQQPVQPKKPGIGARIGYFFLSMAPAAACLLLQVILGAVYMIAAGVIQMIAFMMANPGASQEAAMEYYWQAIMDAATGGVFLYHLLSLPIFGLWYYFGCKRPKMKQSFKNVSVKAVIIAVIGGVTMCLMSNGIVGIQAYVMPNVVQDFYELMEGMDIGFDILATIATVCLAPIGEEILCRGLILYYGKKAFPHFWMANILQALMFGFIHLNWVQGIYAFAGGLFMGWLAEKNHSLIPCMIVHFVINFSSTFWIDKAFFWFPDELYAYIILFVVTTVIALALVFWGGFSTKAGVKAEKK